MTETVLTAFAEAGLWPGLGRTLAGALAGAGITTPDDVSAARLRALPQVSPERADRLVQSFVAAQPSYAVVELLLRGGLPARLAAGAVRVLGPTAAGVLQQDPWRLLDVPAVRVVEADRLARALEPDVQRTDRRRGRALVVHVLARAARDGSSCLPADVVASAVQGEGFPDPAGALEAALEDGRVVAAEGEGPALLSLVRWAMAEEAVAEGVARLLATAEPVDAAPLDASLDEVQQSAVAAALRHGVSVLTGGPGTGKSRTVGAVVAAAQAQGRSVALAAPTGRAAKRLEELCDAPATTLHRLLGAQGTSGEFARGEAWPLDDDVIVVDEASMLDAELAAALLEACPDGCHLLLVGDPAQLPSIGAGRVLGDVVISGAVPVTELTTLYRQSEGGSIARLAGAVRRGELPALPPDPAKEVVVVPARESAEAAHRTVQLVTDSIPRALGIPVSDVQVVTPVHRGPAGTVELNAALKARLNPGDGEVGGFDVGDRVVATANHLPSAGGEGDGRGFANGEVGTVTGTQDGGLVVTFTGTGPVTVPLRAVGDLSHGWAITVHRAQGSEFPAVVAVLPPESGGLLSRPLVYTAFTRAQRHLSVVHAAGAALARAVSEVGARPRRTRLAGLLREAAAQL